MFSSGIVEGLNNKAKVTMRKAYGFRTVRPQAQSQPDHHTTLPPARAVAVQPQDRARLPPQGGLSAILRLRLPDMGRQVPRRLVQSGHAFAHRTDEKSRQNPPRAPPTDPQLFPRQKNVLERHRRGPQQQGKGHHAKSLWFPHLPYRRDLPLPRPRQPTRTKTRP